MFLLPLQPLPGAPPMASSKGSGLFDISTGFRDMLQNAQQLQDAEGAPMLALPERPNLKALVAELLEGADKPGGGSERQIVSVLVPEESSIEADFIGPGEADFPVPVKGEAQLTRDEEFLPQMGQVAFEEQVAAKPQENEALTFFATLFGRSQNSVKPEVNDNATGVLSRESGSESPALAPSSNGPAVAAPVESDRERVRASSNGQSGSTSRESGRNLSAEIPTGAAQSTQVPQTSEGDTPVVTPSVNRETPGLAQEPARVGGSIAQASGAQSSRVNQESPQSGGVPAQPVRQDGTETRSLPRPAGSAPSADREVSPVGQNINGASVPVMQEDPSRASVIGERSFAQQQGGTGLGYTEGSQVSSGANIAVEPLQQIDTEDLAQPETTRVPLKITPVPVGPGDIKPSVRPEVSQIVDPEWGNLPRSNVRLTRFSQAEKQEGMPASSGQVRTQTAAGGPAISGIEGSILPIHPQDLPTIPDLQTSNGTELKNQMVPGSPETSDAESGSAEIDTPVPNPVGPAQHRSFALPNGTPEFAQVRTPGLAVADQPIIPNPGFSVANQTEVLETDAALSADGPPVETFGPDENQGSVLAGGSDGSRNENANRGQRDTSGQRHVGATLGLPDEDGSPAFKEFVSSDSTEPVPVSRVDLNTQNIDRIPGRPELRFEMANGLSQPVSTTDIPDRQLAAMPSDQIDREYQVSDQVIRNIRGMFRQGNSQVTMRLDPKELGEVTIRLSTRNQVVSGEIMVENHKVQEIVQRNMGALREAMVGQGIHLDTINVSVNDRGAQSNREAFRENMQGRSEERGSREQPQSDSRWEQDERQQRRAGNGQVDYMA
jgi:hypothetical protein